ncbi:MAG: hypothetical protein A2751_01910 [Candidatus Doudnabacteria bacterium RIFCSPHIGHO2_01_FULL_46_14]|uniref:Nudix hydrolase domain-containing protein n=1 Tax=Candidatus Doudnabacteria bacterium RIFCSPHIGHO2_01_FULL_46_14 TaxID=1817824 RepID=A0A1F5NK60_9BACT|nr:MAG: hypothetical protein A2751_01910 [Candidatus Doudnabacteria bacterium RIFCSPHIGHO2_01_FULL_46_14]
MGEIPANAKRAYKGKIFEIWQWEQKMFDGSTEVFEMLKRPNTIQIIATVKKKILVTREEQPERPVREFGLYGGRGEEGEEPLETAKRELLEESGMESDHWELWKTYQPFVKAEWTIYVFIARNCRKVAEPRLDNGEKIEQHEIGFEQFVEKVTDDSFWAPSFSNDILRLKLEGRLDEFKNKLFK